MRGLQDWDDAALLAGRDEPAATYAAFYRRHVQVVLRYYARQGLEAADAADLTAETFAAALLARKRYRAALGPAQAWLLGIAKNKLADSRRRFAREHKAQHRLAMEPIELTDQDIEGYEALQHDVATLADAVEGLPPEQRDALRARVLEDETYGQIAQRLGISEPTARQRVSRGLAKLRGRLEER